MLEDGIEKGMRIRGEKIRGLKAKVPENKIKDKIGNSEMALSFRIAFFGVFADFFKWLAKKLKKKKKKENNNKKRNPTKQKSRCIRWLRCLIPSVPNISGQLQSSCKCLLPSEDAKATTVKRMSNRANSGDE